MPGKQNLFQETRVPGKYEGLINFMPGVERYREELSYLGGQWDLLTILGKMSGTAIEMSGTREGFQSLSTELLTQLGLETLKKTVQDISAKAQVTVDIVIRNLFERTADIGFLATDYDIRQYLCNFQRLETSELESARAGIEKRFREYVAKYTVYFDIVLFDTVGKIVARLENDDRIDHSCDSLIRGALETSGDFVEVFGKIDFLPDAGDSLVYAFRVTETNHSGSKPLGVLALCFRFQNEMEGVFAKLSNSLDWTILTLLDKKGFVIASSDVEQIRIGAKMKLALDDDYHIVRFAGREYLAKTCATRGYEGFMGLGWLGHVMLPLDHAFDQVENLDLGQRINTSVLTAVMGDPQLFSKELRNIPKQAEDIQSELERTVWNGNISKGDRSTKVLLWNISDTGARTKSVFESSISNLHETAISSILEDVEFQAALAVDIMDRNLYERANDCRWWALAEFKGILAKDNISDIDLKKMTNILEYINSLYTVYTNLFIYDRKGKILAVSNSDANHLVGTVVEQAWVRETLSLRNSQQYSVSPFEPSYLYYDRHTFIYGAAITHPADSSVILGGIGIVFDSTPQFRAMLMDSLSRDNNGQINAGCFGLFANREGLILSSTNRKFPEGGHIELDPGYFSLENGAKMSGIVSLNDYYYAVGACTSSGYREYKITDGYKYDIIGLIFVPLAQVSTLIEKNAQHVHSHVDSDISWTAQGDHTDFATFYIGNYWFGIESVHVLEAIRYKNITTIPGAPPMVKGTVLYNGQVTLVVSMDRLIAKGNEDIGCNASQIVIVECILNGLKYRFGITVDSLGETPHVSNDLIDHSLSLYQENSYIRGVVKPGPHTSYDDVIIILNPQSIMAGIMGSEDLETTLDLNDLRFPALVTG